MGVWFTTWIAPTSYRARPKGPSHSFSSTTCISMQILNPWQLAKIRQRLSWGKPASGRFKSHSLHPELDVPLTCCPPCLPFNSKNEKQLSGDWKSLSLLLFYWLVTADKLTIIYFQSKLLDVHKKENCCTLLSLIKMLNMIPFLNWRSQRKWKKLMSCISLCCFPSSRSHQFMVWISDGHTW